MFILAATLLTGCGVAERTFDADNMIHNYEWFYDTYNAVEAKRPLIETHKSYLAEETDPDEKFRLRMELTGMQQSCRNMVADYNANASKANVSIFQGRDVPGRLSLTVCD